MSTIGSPYLVAVRWSVLGRYALPAPEGETTVAVKVVDMLSEEVLVVERV